VSAHPEKATTSSKAADESSILIRRLFMDMNCPTTCHSTAPLRYQGPETGADRHAYTSAQRYIAKKKTKGHAKHRADADASS
jgi:hypothetical protein